MPWFRLEDSFHGNPKVADAGNGPVGLWVRCGTWSAQWLKDGWVKGKVAREMGTAREIKRLTDVGLWTPADGGFIIPDFLDYNLSAEEVRLHRQREADKKRRQRANVGRSPTNGQYVSHRLSPGDDE